MQPIGNNIHTSLVGITTGGCCYFAARSSVVGLCHLGFVLGSTKGKTPTTLKLLTSMG